MTVGDAHLPEFLTQLERRESRLLSWGVVDGGFSKSELLTLAEDFLQVPADGEECEDLLKALLERGLIFRFNRGAGNKPVYRTRMAETIRLSSKLRQIFPNRPWRLAPTLVADYRLAIAGRRYPLRSTAGTDVLADASTKHSLSAIQREVLSILLGVPEAPLNLARFQEQALDRMLGDLRKKSSRGMIIGAGTGTGKTKAFYTPALSYIADSIQRGSHFTKVVAIYPRNELLKDQLQEAFREARRLDGTLERKLTIGAFFGPTPPTTRAYHLTGRWPKRGDSFVCPYLTCPNDGCGGQLVWYRGDLEADKHRLTCSDCEKRIEGNELLLTREAMEENPPDLLFTTTEMMNRQLSDSGARQVFGVGARRPPRIVLLDEVHTYSGTHGAQVAYLLRRWQHAIASPLHICGLSATLEDASQFFASLTGLRSSEIEAIEPHESDLEVRGVEYQLALRSDPAARISTLSTTIQMLMLLGRCLDPPHNPISEGLYGTRTFAFTDDLDVTNRLYHNLLDAEGRTAWDTPKRNGTVLASLRSHTEEEAAQRFEAGQSWLMVEELRGPGSLEESLSVGRTSSQDAGLDADADVIVATASLEVGVNDPEVGAVVQHKAPRDTASFLQRKGRAGRIPKMRPWTVVVLSDYGRDRLAYQAYDQLFAPVLEPRHLPVGNRHILKMQAVYGLMDWVAQELSSKETYGSVWRDFSGPTDKSWIRRRQAAEIGLLEELLNGEHQRLPSLKQYLREALQISSEEVVAILWEAPRSLLGTVVPTLLRRLETGWKRTALPHETATEPFTPNAPLTEFIPSSLFSDLNLPDVEVVTPPEFEGDESSQVAMPILQAMRTFAPGRASRRFGIRNDRATHWIAPPPIDDGEGIVVRSLAVSEIATESDYLGHFEVETDGEVLSLPCYRARRIEPTVVPSNVAPTSNAFLKWESQIGPTAAGYTLPIPEGGAWQQVFAGAIAYMHNRQSHALVRRFATGAHGRLQRRTGDATDFVTVFTDPHSPTQEASLGFSLQVDAVVFQVRIPEEITRIELDPTRERDRALRTAYFRHRVMTHDDLQDRTNRFQRQWLAQIYLSALTEHAIANDTDVVGAVEALSGEVLLANLNRVMEIIFQSLPGIDGADDTASDTGGDREQEPDWGQRQAELEDILADPVVTRALAESARDSPTDVDAPFTAWIVERFKATVGGALLEAIYRLCPQIEEADLLLDLRPGRRPTECAPEGDADCEIWLTETTLGGAGQIEMFTAKYLSDPRRFFQLLEQSLEPSDLEQIDMELTRFLSLLSSDSEISSAVQACRKAVNQADLHSGAQVLVRRLTERGMLASHAVVAAIFSRLLRPGSSSQTDALIRGLVEDWRAQERELGINIDARVYAYLKSADEQLDSALSHIDDSFRRSPQWRFQVLYGLLWARSDSIRSRNLETYSPFTEFPRPERELLSDVLKSQQQVVSLSDDDWRGRLATALKRSGFARLGTHYDHLKDLQGAMCELATTPLEIGYLHSYPSVQAVRRDGEEVIVEFGLREAAQ